MILSVTMKDAVKIEKYLKRYAMSCLEESKRLNEEFSEVGDVIDILEDAMDIADVVTEGGTGAGKS